MSNLRRPRFEYRRVLTIKSEGVMLKEEDI